MVLVSVCVCWSGVGQDQPGHALEPGPLHREPDPAGARVAQHHRRVRPGHQRVLRDRAPQDRRRLLRNARARGLPVRLAGV